MVFTSSNNIRESTCKQAPYTGDPASKTSTTGVHAQSVLPSITYEQVQKYIDQVAKTLVLYAPRMKPGDAEDPADVVARAPMLLLAMPDNYVLQHLINSFWHVFGAHYLHYRLTGLASPPGMSEDEFGNFYEERTYDAQDILRIKMAAAQMLLHQETYDKMCWILEDCPRGAVLLTYLDKMHQLVRATLPQLGFEDHENRIRSITHNLSFLRWCGKPTIEHEALKMFIHLADTVIATDAPTNQAIQSCTRLMRIIEEQMFKCITNLGRYAQAQPGLTREYDFWYPHLLRQNLISHRDKLGKGTWRYNAYFNDVIVTLNVWSASEMDGLFHPNFKFERIKRWDHMLYAEEEKSTKMIPRSPIKTLRRTAEQRACERAAMRPGTDPLRPAMNCGPRPATESNRPATNSSTRPGTENRWYDVFHRRPTTARQ